MGTGPKTPATQVPAIHPAGDVDSEDFLEFIWGERKGWVDLPAKVGQYWVPFYMRWPPNYNLLAGRIDGSIRDQEDLYYSVNMFRAKGRSEEDTLPGQWLWADLDEVQPGVAINLGLMPTIAVESSQGRYQALWKLARPLKTNQLLMVNRGLTYALDADKGGYDLTQVLRLPGTFNHKYPDQPYVRILWMREDVVYDPNDVWKMVKSLVPKVELDGAVTASFERRPIPRKAKNLLRTKAEEVVEGERSDRLWELECLLVESGLEDPEIADLIWDTPWNKWRQLGTGRDRLTKDIRKARRHVSGKRGTSEAKTGVLDRGRSDRGSDKPSSEGAGVVDDDAGPTVEESADGSERLPFVPYGSFVGMALPKSRWLIKNLWTLNSHGLIAGEPKTNKTTLALALSLSVATGVPFLRNEEYSVHDQGTVLFIQEENSPKTIQERILKLSHFYKVLGTGVQTHTINGKTTYDIDFPEEIPIRFLNNFGYNLDLEEHRDMLEAEVEEHQPRLIVLDPMYLILNADENSSTSLRPFLRWLLDLRYRYNTAIVVIHHNRKAPTQKGAYVPRAGQRVMGSAMLHGWVDSAIYLSHVADDREGWVTVGLDREFRSMAPRPTMTLGLKLGEPDRLDTEVEWGSISTVVTLEDRIFEAVSERNHVPIQELAQDVGASRQVVERRCLADKRLVVEKGVPGRAPTRVHLMITPKGRKIRRMRNGDGP
jgi:hypothetical protein